MIPTPAQRFAAHDIAHALVRIEGGAELARLLREAAYFDGFPESYTAEQVEAGRALIVAVATHTDIEASAERVRAVHS